MFKPTFLGAAVVLPVLGLLFASGCGNQPGHPNQINTFDGVTYDTMVLAHGALTSLRVNVATSYPQYTPAFNQAAAAYGVAYAAYSTFRMTPTTEADVNVTITNLTVAIVNLENAFQTDMQVSPAAVTQASARAKRLRGSAKQAGISVSDLLTELEIAAAVAQTIPQAGPYAQLAEVVIQTTTAALVAESADVGQPIDLTQIPPVAAIQ